MNSLIEWHRKPDFDSPPALLYAFAGFVDAGFGVRLAADHLLASCEHELIASFDVDQLVDYRARRPRMVYSVDRFLSADMPQISLYGMRDLEGRPFLLLVGPEPDYRWRHFIDAVTEAVQRVAARVAVGLSAIPWPAPHTRPLEVTLHGTESDLVEGRSNVIGEIEVPGHVGALLELHLGQQGVPSVGVTAQVPHYLGQFEYPSAAIALLQGAEGLAGLALPIEGIRAAAERAEREVAEQVSGNDEFAAVVAALEQQYDQIATMRSQAEELAPGGAVPSGEEIAAQVEQFLQGLSDDQDGSR